MRRRAQYPRDGGFTLIEMLIILALIGILSTFVMFAMQGMISRERLLGSTREASVGMRLARLEAIKTNRSTAVVIDTADNSVLSFVDEDDDGVFDSGERMLNRYTLPGGVNFASPDGTAMTDIVDGFETTGTKGIARFNADGSVDAVGAFRMADSRGNFLEIRVDPRAVARAKMRKFDGTDWVGRDDATWVWK